MKSQKELIFKRDYDYLFILDACRYDVLSEVYNNYFDGELKRVDSQGTMTKEWVENTFIGENLDDVIYISGNPWVNSIQPMEGVDVRDVFYKIKDGWNREWSARTETTMPSGLTKILRKVEIQHPDKKKIIHMMQPHAPYLDLVTKEHTRRHKAIDKTIDKLNNITNWFNSGKEDPEEVENIPFVNKEGNNIRKKIGHFLVDNFGKNNITRLRALLGIPPTPIWGVLLREGPESLREHYKYNLNRALYEIKKVRKALDGKFVISADHGELLGEQLKDIDNEYHEEFYEDGNENNSLKSYVHLKRNGKKLLYGHPKEFSLPLLKHVPWLEVRSND